MKLVKKLVSWKLDALVETLADADAYNGLEHEYVAPMTVDHIEQYLHDGQPIPENARLTHRYCNMARSRND